MESKFTEIGSPQCGQMIVDFFLTYKNLFSYVCKLNSDRNYFI